MGATSLWRVWSTICLSWSGRDALWGLSFFSRLSIPLATPESCISCMVIWAMAFRNVGDLGLKMEWNCWLRVLALSTPVVNVFPFAFKDDMPLLSCLECFSREYSFLVLTLVGLVMSCVSGFIPRISPMYRPFQMPFVF